MHRVTESFLFWPLSGSRLDSRGLLKDNKINHRLFLSDRRYCYGLSEMRNQNAGRDLPDVRLPGDPAAEKGQEPEKMGKARTLNCVSKRDRIDFRNMMINGRNKNGVRI